MDVRHFGQEVLFGFYYARHDRDPKSRRRVNHHAGAVTAHGLGREGHASAVGWHHGLDNHGHTWLCLCVTQTLAVGQRWRRPPGRPAGLNRRPEGVVLHVQKRRIHASKRRGGAVLRHRRRTHRPGRWRWRILRQHGMQGLAHRRRWCASENLLRHFLRGRRGGQVQLAHIRRQSRRGQHTAWRHGQPGLEQTSQVAPFPPVSRTSVAAEAVKG